MSLSCNCSCVKIHILTLTRSAINQSRYFGVSCLVLKKSAVEISAFTLEEISSSKYKWSCSQQGLWIILSNGVMISGKRHYSFLVFLTVFLGGYDHLVPLY